MGSGKGGGGGGATNAVICNWAAPEYGEAGQNAIHTALQVAAFVVAIHSAYTQWDVCQQRYEIADAYARMAEERWLRFDTKYKPLEAAMVAEVMSEPAVKPDYDLEDGSLGAFAEARDEMRRLSSRYRLCLGPPDLETAAALVRDDSLNFNYRWAEYHALERDDWRWNRRSGLLNLGRHLASQAATYAGLADQALAGVGAMAGSALSGAMSYLGYNEVRQTTYFPGYPDNFIRSGAPGSIMSAGGNHGVPGLDGAVEAQGVERT